MKIKDKLVQYCDLQKEIKNLEKRIERLEKQSEIVADVVQKGYKGRAVIRGIDQVRIYKLNKLKQVLQKRYDMCLEMQTEIEEYINNIEKSDIRQIFEYRYIDNMNWIQIGHIMQSTQDAVRVKHDRYLEKVS